MLSFASSAPNVMQHAASLRDHLFDIAGGKHLHTSRTASPDGLVSTHRQATRYSTVTMRRKHTAHTLTCCAGT